MKNKIIELCILCSICFTGCSTSSPIVGESIDYDSQKNETDEENSINDKDDSSVSDSSVNTSVNANNSSSGIADGIPWKSPMSDYVPKSPFSKYIEFVKGEITTERNDKLFSDYISGKYKYVCCDISGDGVQELIVSFSVDDKEELVVFGYNSEEDTIIVDLNQDINSEYDCISKYGFMILNVYKDESGELFRGKTDDTSCTQWIEVVLTNGSSLVTGDVRYEWKREAGSSEFEGPSEEIYNHIMEMADDQVTLYEGVNPEDMIPYLEECEENFENSYEDFKLFKQQGNGLFYRNNSDIPDNEYKDAESAYEAFINDETCVRCEYVKEPFNSDFSYVYGDKCHMSSLFHPENSQTMEYHLIDCGSNGSKELVVDITSTLNSETVDYLYVISYYEGHLYLRFSGESSSRARIDIGDDGYIYSSGSSSAYTHGKEEAFFDSNVDFQYIYVLHVVSSEDLEEYFPEAYEISPAGEGSTINIYDIDGKEYYVPYGWDEPADEEDYTDFMNACIECGITFSSQEEVDALIEEKKAEYGF